jgi:hypothetical protein
MFAPFSIAVFTQRFIRGRDSAILTPSSSVKSKVKVSRESSDAFFCALSKKYISLARRVAFGVRVDTLKKVKTVLLSMD